MKKLFIKLTLLTLMACFVGTGLTPASTSALSGSEFNPGRIIDDNIFFNGTDISASEIQSWLAHQGRDCQSSTPGCLKDYYVYTGGRASDEYCSGSVSGGWKKASQIIADVGVACSVNPKVLLVLLQKEQGLVTTTQPTQRKYDAATGYACPDTASCDPAYAGLDNQLYFGARQYQRYAKLANSYNYRVGQNANIPYQANSSTCGGSQVFIQTQATAGLYNYTPYQPNAAALKNLYGTGDSCSAYGNRNFWRLFNDWFGSPISSQTAHTLNFTRLNHHSGKVELIGLPSLGNYSYVNRNTLTSQTTLPTDSSVIPQFRPNGDLSFIKLNGASGKVEVTTYSAQSNFQQVSSVIHTSYPAVPADGSVIPQFRPNGDLSFIRLNHYSGKVEVVTYSFGSYFQSLSSNLQTGYPAVATDGSVIPQFRPNGDLSFIRLNHYSGKVEVVTYSFGSYFQSLSSNLQTGYPAVATDGSVIPQFRPNGDLSFIRLNHYSGKVEVVTYSFGSYFQLIANNVITAYPTVPADGSVITQFSR